MSDPTFVNGRGIAVHIRTEIVRQWSYIKTVVIRIGEDILEVEGGADENRYWFNKLYQGELSTIGGFPVKYKKANSKQRVFNIDFGDGEGIEIRTYKDFVRIDFKGAKKHFYEHTVGILGDYNSGKKLARDGVTIIEDYNAFGEEWQVSADGPKLFHELAGPQAPDQKCISPSQFHAEEKRHLQKRLGAPTAVTKSMTHASVTEIMAELACAKVSVAERDACVSDVLITGDVEMAGAY
jgi:hypothetical protein